MGIKRAFIVTFVGISLFSSCRQQMPERTEYVLGTICTINLFDQGSDAIYTESFNRLKKLESILSANREDTNIAAINAAAGEAPVKAAPETLSILRDALIFSDKTGGLFDPSIGPLVKAWNIGTDYAAIPKTDVLHRSMSLVNYHDIIIDDKNETVFLTKKGMKLDLGAIAKGYAADDIARLLKSKKIKKAIIDLGGNIYALGEKEPGKDWNIGIRDPETERGEPILSISVNNTSVVTSGIYERFFEANGKKYHHILDPRTGYPAENDLLSVTIVATSSMDADALSTSTFLLGADKGMSLIEQTKNVDAIFINKKREVRLSSGLLGKVKVLDERFTLIN
jgi:thiamine biosynthesis lipoprotein